MEDFKTGELDLELPRKVAIQPSSKEGFGLVVTEALAKGTLAIAPLIGGISSQLKNLISRAGWLGLEYPETEVDSSIKLYENMEKDQLDGKDLDFTGAYESLKNILTSAY